MAVPGAGLGDPGEEAPEGLGEKLKCEKCIGYRVLKSNECGQLYPYTLYRGGEVRGGAIHLWSLPYDPMVAHYMATTMSLLKGRAHKYGDNINTDVIIPSRYCLSQDAADLATHCLEDLDEQFVQKVASGDLIVAGRNFGCGSSREHAPLAIKGVGVSCVIAVSFARIFFRNAINIGLPIVESGEAAEAIEDGDEVEVDLSTGTVRIPAQELTFQARPVPETIREIIEAGGMVEYVKRRMARARAG